MAVEQFLEHPAVYEIVNGIPTDAANANVNKLAVELWERRTIGESLRDESMNITIQHYIDWVNDQFNEFVATER